MIKFIIAVAIVVGLVILTPAAYQKYTVWDAANPADDDSQLNAILLSMTPRVSAVDVRQGIDFNAAVLIVDTRETEDYDKKHITGAVSISQGKLLEDYPKRFPEKSSKVYVYGYDDNRAAVATRLLIDMGYAASYIDNGLRDWESAGFGTEKTNGMYF